MNDIGWASAAAALASIFFGASVVATRFVVHEIDPLLLAFIRYLIATICLAPVVVWTARARIRPVDLAAIAGLGIVFFGLFPWFFSAGLKYIPSSRGALWLATMPFLTFGLAALLRFEPVTWPRLAGVALATTGVGLALGGRALPAIGMERAWLGDLLLFATACCGAVYFVFSRPVLKRVPALPVTCLSMAAGTLFLGVLAAGGGLLGAMPDLTRAGWLAVAFLGTFGAAIGFFLWIWALQRSTPTRTAVFLTLNPMAATLLGAVLLDEAITPAFLVGLACVLAGIVVANLPPVRAAVGAAPAASAASQAATGDRR